MTTAIKICGLTDEVAIQAVIADKAEYAGFIFYPASPRHLSLEKAAELCAQLPESIHSVAVTVDASDAEIFRICTRVKPHYMQLHGKESPQRVAEIKSLFPSTKLIKALQIRSGDDVSQAMRYTDADMLLFDAKPPNLVIPSAAEGSKATSRNADRSKIPPQGRDDNNEWLPGGNGLSFDWALLKGRSFQKPWMLSGGLTSENIADAIHQSGATMVDVSSGVERAPGVKDAVLIAEFTRAARN